MSTTKGDVTTGPHPSIPWFGARKMARKLAVEVQQLRRQRDAALKPRRYDLSTIDSIGRDERGHRGSARSYKGTTKVYADRRAAAVAPGTPRFAAIVAPLSSRQDADVNRAAIAESTKSRDLTGGFSRKGRVKAGAVESVEEVINEFDYAPLGGETEIKSLLIVDELVGRGNTIAAVLHHLRKAGLSKDCQITVAVAAWLIGKAE